MLGWLRKRNLGLSAFGRFTDRLRKSMAVANRHATAMGCEKIASEHLLMALIGDEVGMGVGKAVLACREVDFVKMGERLGLKPVDEAAALRKLPLRAAAKQAIQRSIEEARELGDDYVGTEHLLQALSRVDGTREVLADFGVNHAALRAGVHMMRAQVAQGQGKFARVRAELEKALAGEVDFAVLNGAAWVLATCAEVRDGGRAVSLATRACEGTGFGNASCLDTLAAAYAANGAFEEAVRTAERALALKPDLTGGSGRVACYRAGRAWEEK